MNPDAQIERTMIPMNILQEEHGFMTALMKIYNYETNFSSDYSEIFTENCLHGCDFSNLLYGGDHIYKNTIPLYRSNYDADPKNLLKQDFRFELNPSGFKFHVPGSWNEGRVLEQLSRDALLVFNVKEDHYVMGKGPFSEKKVTRYIDKVSRLLQVGPEMRGNIALVSRGWREFQRYPERVRFRALLDMERAKKLKI